MTKESKCVAGCPASPVILTPVPLCALHGLEVAQEVVSGVLSGSLGTARREAARARSLVSLAAVAAPPAKARSRPDRLAKDDARRLFDDRLAALKEGGIERVKPRHFQDIARMAGRSRPWVYMVLGELASAGVLVSDARSDEAGYRFAA